MGSAAASIGSAVASTGASYLMDEVMGGDERGGGYKKKTSSPYTRAQRSLLADVVKRTQESMDEGFPTYEKDIVPGPTETQRGAAEFARGTLEDQIPALQERGLGMLEPEQWDPSRARERWEQTVMEPARRQFHEEIAPNIMERYAGRNALDSSAVGRALAESGEDITQKGMSQLADLEFRDYQRHQQRQMDRAQMGQSLLGQALQRAGAAADVSSPLRQIEQQQAAEEYQQWQRGQEWSNPWLQNYLGQIMGVQPQRNAFVSQPPSAMSQLSQTLLGQGAQSLGSGLGKVLGGGSGGGMSGFSGMFSGGSPTPGTAGFNPPAM